jgi:hypothetical protein
MQKLELLLWIIWGPKLTRVQTLLKVSILPIDSKHKVWCNPDRQLLY